MSFQQSPQQPSDSADEGSVGDAVGPAVIEAPSPALPFYVVGVGASAGGLEALQPLFQEIKPHIGMSFLVIQHLSPNFKSMMVTLLQRHTELKVVQAEDLQSVEVNHIYLLPPARTLHLERGRIRLTERDPFAALHHPIDVMFASLAKDQRDLSMAVILSGTGSDGSRGLRAVKEAGGMVLVQEPTTAKFDGMPNSAIHTGCAGRVLDPSAIGLQLMAWSSLVRQDREPLGTDGEADDSVMRRLLGFVLSRTGIDFGLYKVGTVQRRLRRRMLIVGDTDLAEYSLRVQREADELSALVQDVLVGVTHFRRDVEAWETLRQLVFPNAIASAVEHGVLRAWVVGCSTGEEAYTLAMGLLDHVRAMGLDLQVKVFATDVNREAIAVASAGAFPAGALVEIPTTSVERYFEPRNGAWVVNRTLREAVTFAVHNVLTDPPFTRLDLITCRNMLIYLRNEVQTVVFRRMHFGLRDHGHLMLGPSESLGEYATRFEVLDPKWKIFRNLGGGKTITGAMLASRARPARGAPAFELRATSGSDQLLEFMVNQYVAAGVAVDPMMRVVHVFGDPSPYLRFRAGRMGVSLTRLLPERAAVVVSATARRARQQRTELLVSDLELCAESENQPALRANLRIVPVPRTTHPEDLLLVFFDRHDDNKLAVRRADGVGVQALDARDMDLVLSKRIEELEGELQLTRQNLHTAVQDLETSNEELQATNEEMVAANEELQSTNEELQSVNEELYSVNAEFQDKIFEFEHLTQDLEHLLATIDAGVLFLDSELRIRRFSAATSILLPLRTADIGRPLNEIAIQADYDEFEQDVASALADGDPIFRDVVGNEGGSWAIHIRRLADGFSSGASSTDQRPGVLVTLHGLSGLGTRDRLAIGIFEAVTTAIWEQGTRLAIVDPAEMSFGILHGSLIGRSITAPPWRPLGSAVDAPEDLAARLRRTESVRLDMRNGDEICDVYFPVRRRRTSPGQVRVGMIAASAERAGVA